MGYIITDQNVIDGIQNAIADEGSWVQLASIDGGSGTDTWVPFKNTETVNGNVYLNAANDNHCSNRKLTAPWAQSQAFTHLTQAVV